jgi:cytochrome P450
LCLEHQIINETEAVDTCLTIVVAGLGAMAHLLSTGMLALLRHKDQHNQLVHAPELIPQALEEMLRYEPATNFTSVRVATQSAQLSNVEIPSGAKVICLLAAANRDELIFKCPNVFDIHRQSNQHLAFGGGIHQCLGNTLFRLAGRTVLLELLNTLPNLKLRRGLAGCQPSHSWIRAASTRGLRHLFLTH